MKLNFREITIVSKLSPNYNFLNKFTVSVKYPPKPRENELDIVFDKTMLSLCFCQFGKCFPAVWCFFYDWSSLVISFCLWFKASGLLKDIVQTLQQSFYIFCVMWMFGWLLSMSLYSFKKFVLKISFCNLCI